MTTTQSSTLLQNLEKDGCSVIYNALYNYQGESLESREAKLSVISSDDMAYEWFKGLYWCDTCENDKYIGVTTTSVVKVGQYETEHQIKRYTFNKKQCEYAYKNAKSWKHFLRLIIKGLKLIDTKIER